MTKIQSHVMLVLRNVRMLPSNVSKSKRTTESDKNTVTCDVSITKCEDGAIKCEKKIRELPNVTKVQLYMILVLYNVMIVPSNVIFW